MMVRIDHVCLLLAATTLLKPAESFAPSTDVNSLSRRNSFTPHVSIAPNENDFFDETTSDDFLIEKEESLPLLRFGSGSKEKVVTLFGLWCVVVTMITCPIWLAAMETVKLIYRINDSWDPNRTVYDTTGKIWSKTWLTLTNSYPTFSGEVHLLNESDQNEACLFVANHASWLDIPVLCTILDRSFKFIAKGELGKLPCIGHQLIGGQHILIDREDRRSQLRSFKEGIQRLKDGVPVMAFPEGKRSRDGRLMDFKGGLFAMAKKTGVPIVPITLSHTHAIMPSYALFPVQPGSGKLHIHVHPPIYVEDKTDQELDELVRQNFVSSLPEYQHPVKKASKAETATLAR